MPPYIRDESRMYGGYLGWVWVIRDESRMYVWQIRDKSRVYQVSFIPFLLRKLRKTSHPAKTP